MGELFYVRGNVFYVLIEFVKYRLKKILIGYKSYKWGIIILYINYKILIIMNEYDVFIKVIYIKIRFVWVL